MKTIAETIIALNTELPPSFSLPKGYQVEHPFLSHSDSQWAMKQFYNKYYNDKSPRHFIIGINPGRHGAAITGVPFTDTKRLAIYCGITMPATHSSHEVSALFMYDMIQAYGGVQLFYQHFFIHSLFPFALLKQTASSKWVNANYYDLPELFQAVKPFMIHSLSRYLSMGLITQKVIVLGKKNALFIERLNKEYPFFEEMIVLEHPRYIQQYKASNKQAYIDKYLLALDELHANKS